MTDDQIIEEIIAREGTTYTNNSADKGGPTKFGITLETLKAWRKYPCNAGDVEALEIHEARQIYRKLYLEDTHIIALQSPLLRGVVLDCAVLHGPKNAIRMLQRSLGMKDDGVILHPVLGSVTLTTANAWDPRRLGLRVVADRIKFLGRLISKDLTDKDLDGIPDNTEFASGWLNRAASFIEGMA